MKTREIEWMKLSRITISTLPRHSPSVCKCGSGMEPRIVGRCAECATAEEMNYYLFMRGLRATP